MKLLCVSNGHGEDAIALRILQPLGEMSPGIELFALPIAGAGEAYVKASIPLIGPARTLPSGGFLNRDPKQLARDVGGGLLSLTRSQLSATKQWAKSGDVILAVGDIVPLTFAHLSGLPYAFVGTAKSEYWLRDERGKLPVSAAFPASLLQKLEGWSGSVYLPWECWLMSQGRARAVFVRDELTAKQLRQRGVRAECAGNPMMDGLAATGKLADLLKRLRLPRLPKLPVSEERLDIAETANQQAARSRATALYVTKKQQPVTPLTIALLPGSRVPEAYENWGRMLAAVPGMVKSFPLRPLILLAAIAPSLSLASLQAELTDWELVTTASPDSCPTSPYPTFTYGDVTLLIVTDAYSDCLHEAEIAIATAGTATEQFVGLGKLAITLPGDGPQFTAAFAKVQAKMLGPSIQMVASPDAVGPAVAKIMSDPDRLQLVYENGRRRMGEAGAGRAIAQKLVEKVLLTPSAVN